MTIDNNRLDSSAADASKGDAVKSKQATQTETRKAAVEEVYWTHEGDYGPDHWGELSSSFGVCRWGKQQSPIDLVGRIAQQLPAVTFHYQPSEIRILNNGHTIQVNYDAGSHLETNGKRYDLLQFHFHSPSEHTIDGQRFAAELHLVHKSVDGQLAVVGLLLQEGEENRAFEAVWHHFPAEETAETSVGEQVNALDFLPDDRTSYRYNGSLTMPPCTEGVSWFVMTTPVTISANQLAAFRKIFHGNNRPVQALQRHQIVTDKPSSCIFGPAQCHDFIVPSRLIRHRKHSSETPQKMALLYFFSNFFPECI
ncbi:MAG: carbonic anhydrase family protein [Candidatus Competibacteraceae bacterium]|nr:carbonic anhydrase family protein [Candidatus Competibacteraceae bacterium]